MNFPEIKTLSKRDASEALKLAILNRDSIKPAFRADLDARIEAIRERLREIFATEHQGGR